MKGKPENRLLGHHFYHRPLNNNVVIIALGAINLKESAKMVRRIYHSAFSSLRSWADLSSATPAFQ